MICDWYQQNKRNILRTSPDSRERNTAQVAGDTSNAHDTDHTVVDSPVRAPGFFLSSSLEHTPLTHTTDTHLRRDPAKYVTARRPEPRTVLSPCQFYPPNKSILRRPEDWRPHQKSPAVGRRKLWLVRPPGCAERQPHVLRRCLAARLHELVLARHGWSFGRQEQVVVLAVRARANQSSHHGKGLRQA